MTTITSHAESFRTHARRVLFVALDRDQEYPRLESFCARARVAHRETLLPHAHTNNTMEHQVTGGGVSTHVGLLHSSEYPNSALWSSSPAHIRTLLHKLQTHTPMTRTLALHFGYLATYNPDPQHLDQQETRRDATECDAFKHSGLFWRRSDDDPTKSTAKGLWVVSFSNQKSKIATVGSVDISVCLLSVSRASIPIVAVSSIQYPLHEPSNGSPGHGCRSSGR
jgi:hypothetical protein